MAKAPRQCTYFPTKQTQARDGGGDEMKQADSQQLT